jgi:hypothetical protein
LSPQKNSLIFELVPYKGPNSEIMEMKLALDLKYPKHRQLARLIIGADDIKNAGETALLIINRVRSLQDELIEPLSCAAVIWYARPFISSDEAPGLAGKFSSFQAKSHRELHDRLIFMRNRFTAHMDKEFNEVFLIRKEAPIMVGDSRLEVLSHSPFVETKYLTPAAFPQIVELCNFQLDRLWADIGELKARLFP